MSDVNNTMTGQGDILPIESSAIDAVLPLGEVKPIDGEILLQPIRNNFLSGTASIVQMQNPKLKIMTDNDAYLSSENKYMVYDTSSSLKQGVYNTTEYKSFISFPEINDIDNNIANNILNTTLVFKTINCYYGNIRIYELDRSFQENNITWDACPNKTNLIGQVSVNGESIIRIDLGKYAKDISLENKFNNGFYIESDSYINLYSSNTNIDEYRPYVEVEYYDASKIVSINSMDAEMILKPVSYINGEIILQSAFPTIDGELLLSKPVIYGEIDIRNISSIDGEMLYCFKDISIINAEMLFTQNSIHGYLALGEASSINAEMVLKRNDESTIDAEMILTPVSYINGELSLSFKNSIDGELLLLNAGHSLIDSELILNHQTTIDGEIGLLFKNTIDSELILSKPIINAEVIFNNQSSITGEMLLASIEEIDGEIIAQVYDKSTLDAEMNLIFNGTSIIDSELLLVNSAHAPIDGEIIAQVYDKSTLDAEMNLMFTESKIIDAEIIMNMKNDINAELLFEFRDTKAIDSELILKFIESSVINSELILLNTDHSSIDSELLLVNSAHAPIDGEMTIKFEGNKPIDGELLLEAISSSSIESELLLKFINKDIIDSELLLKFTTNSIIDSELELMFTDKSIIDAEIALQLNSTSIINGEMIFSNNGLISIDGEIIVSRKITNFFYMIEG